MTRLTKIFIIISSAVIVIGLSVGIYCSATFTDGGLLSVSTIDDLAKYKIEKDYILGQRNDEADKYKHFTEEYGQYIGQLKKSPIVAIAKATENFRQFSHSCMQEAQIIKVINGDKYIKENTKVSVFDYLGFKYRNDNLVYQNGLNIMKPNSKYLIFLEPSDLNSFTKEKSYCFSNGSFFACISLDRDSCNKVYNPKNTDIYSYIEQIHNTTSKKIAESIAYAEDKIIAEFIGENKY